MTQPTSGRTGRSGKVIQFGTELAGLVKAEWQNRTAFGKLLFPLWFISSAIQWAMLLSLVGLALYIENVNDALDSAIDATVNALPDTHEEDSK